MNIRILFLATFVYQYDFHDSYSYPGSASGYIQFLEPCGEGDLSSSIYALSVTSAVSPAFDYLGAPLPVILATTFGLGEDTTVPPMALAAR